MRRQIGLHGLTNIDAKHISMVQVWRSLAASANNKEYAALFAKSLHVENTAANTGAADVDGRWNAEEERERLAWH